MKAKVTKLTNTTKAASSLGRICLAFLAASALFAASAFAQPTHQHPATNAPTDTAALQAQLSQLRNQVAELSRIMQSHGSAVPQASGAGGAGMSGMPGMAGGTSSGGMGMMDMDMMKMKGMGNMGGGSGAMSGMGMMNMMGGGMGNMGGGSGSMSGMNMGDMGNMGMMKGMGMMNKGMEMMGMTKGMSGMSMPSALPGFPGASHLYHIGATGFFLDHGEHVKLSTDQQSKLNQIKEKTSLEQATADRKVEEAEQQLWELTASDQPDAKAIEAKIREIEKLRGDQRMAFIRSVGDAAKVLTEEQRRVLTGLAEPQTGSAPVVHQHPTPPGK